MMQGMTKLIVKWWVQSIKKSKKRVGEGTRPRDLTQQREKRAWMRAMTKLSWKKWCECLIPGVRVEKKLRTRGEAEGSCHLTPRMRGEGEGFTTT